MPPLVQDAGSVRAYVRACLRICVHIRVRACVHIPWLACCWAQPLSQHQPQNCLERIWEGGGDFEFKSGESTFLHLHPLSITFIFTPAK